MSVEAAFASFPALRTGRLDLRQIRSEDASRFFEMKSDERVTLPYGQEPHRDVDRTRSWIQSILDGYSRRESIVWCLALRDGGAVVGSCCFWNFGDGHRCAELGYELAPSHRGQGYVHEAVSAVIEWGFADMGLHRLEANPLAANEPSVRVLRKLGFVQEGVLRERVHLRGVALDQLFFGLLRGDRRAP